MIKKPAGKQIPVMLPHFVEVTQMVGFSARQKLRLLLGYKVLLVAFLHTQHAPGRFKPTFRVSLTPHKNPARAYDDTDVQILVAQGEPWPVDMVSERKSAVEEYLEAVSIDDLKAVIASKEKAAK